MDTTYGQYVVDNTTEVTVVEQNVTSSDELQTVTSPAPKSLPLINYVGYTVGFTTGIIGIVANALVLAVLIRARRQFGSNVNTLIINQTVLDFLACCFITISVFLYVTDSCVYDGSRNRFVDMFICIFFDAGALAGVCMAAGKVGLVVITLERYVKIVHAVAHRKHYRDWMTRLAAALPWIVGVGFTMIPSIATTKIIHGFCYRLSIWPNKSMALVSTLFDFLSAASIQIVQHCANPTRLRVITSMYAYIGYCTYTFSF